MISPETRRSLLSPQSSRQNKLWKAVWLRDSGEGFIEWKWAGTYMRSRLLFRFHPDEAFVAAKSFDEDVLPTYKLMEK